jgi:hypothetical protein
VQGRRGESHVGECPKAQMGATGPRTRREALSGTKEDEDAKTPSPEDTRLRSALKFPANPVDRLGVTIHPQIPEIVGIGLERRMPRYLHDIRIAGAVLL